MPRHGLIALWCALGGLAGSCEAGGSDAGGGASTAGDASRAVGADTSSATPGDAAAPDATAVDALGPDGGGADGSDADALATPDPGPALPDVVVTCTAANPAGCSVTGCAVGEYCDSAQGTRPSSCTCDTVSGQWECSADTAGGVCVVPQPGSCPDTWLDTVEGCQDCNRAGQAVSGAIAAAFAAHAACEQDTDCVVVSRETDCGAACSGAVTVGSEAEIAATLAQISADYCTGYKATCGSATPTCPQFDATCVSGVCQVKVAQP